MCCHKSIDVILRRQMSIDATCTLHETMMIEPAKELEREEKEKEKEFCFDIKRPLLKYYPHNCILKLIL